MDIIRLRTLTFKSKLGFGSFPTNTVQDHLDNYSNRILIRAYFTLSKISFTKEVLGILGITFKYYIDKPGVNKDMYHKFLDETMSDSERIKQAAYFRKTKKKKV